MDKKDSIFLATALLLPHFAKQGSFQDISTLKPEFRQLYRIIESLHSELGHHPEDERYIDPDKIRWTE